MKEAVRKFKETVEIKSSAFNRIKEHRYFPLGALLCVVLIVASFHVWQRVRVINLAKEVGRLKNENASLLDAKKKLYIDIAKLTTSSRIERYAMDTLGLKPARADRLFTLKKESSAGEQKDEIDAVMASIFRFVEYIPVIEQTRALATGNEDLNIDSTLSALEEK